MIAGHLYLLIEPTSGELVVMNRDFPKVKTMLEAPVPVSDQGSLDEILLKTNPAFRKNADGQFQPMNPVPFRPSPGQDKKFSIMDLVSTGPASYLPPSTPQPPKDPTAKGQNLEMTSGTRSRTHSVKPNAEDNQNGSDPPETVSDAMKKEPGQCKTNEVKVKVLPLPIPIGTAVHKSVQSPLKISAMPPSYLVGTDPRPKHDSTTSSNVDPEVDLPNPISGLSLQEQRAVREFLLSRAKELGCGHRIHLHGGRLTTFDLEPNIIYHEDTNKNWLLHPEVVVHEEHHHRSPWWQGLWHHSLADNSGQVSRPGGRKISAGNLPWDWVPSTKAGSIPDDQITEASIVAAMSNPFAYLLAAPYLRDLEENDGEDLPTLEDLKQLFQRAAFDML